MIIAHTIEVARAALRDARRAGMTVGFVPTMGALHAGHLSLVAEARRACEYTVVSIFVNPIQFTPGEDFERYPRPLDADLRACEEAGVDLAFVPDTREMYPSDPLTSVSVRKLSAGLCGRCRPGHFDGVATVVAKLLNIVAPVIAFFGEKDYQQLAIIRRMVRDLDMPVAIVGCPTIREPDGLALSSRNRYLSAGQRQQATCLYRAMRDAASAIRQGQADSGLLIEQMKRAILSAGPAQIDYVSIVDPDSLEDVTCIDRAVRICAAIRIGECRLIDNVGVDAGGGNG